MECGRLGRPWGICGALTVYWNNGACPVPEEGGSVFIADSTGYRKLDIISCRPQGRHHVVLFHGIADRNAAATLTGQVVSLPEATLEKLPPGEYYSYQIMGLDVVTETGKKVGKVTNIFSTGANDVYEVTPEGKKKRDTILIPASANVIVAIDVGAKRMMVREIEGLFA